MVPWRGSRIYDTGTLHLVQATRNPPVLSTRGFFVCPDLLAQFRVVRVGEDRNRVILRDTTRKDREVGL